MWSVALAIVMADSGEGKHRYSFDDFVTLGMIVGSVLGLFNGILAGALLKVNGRSAVRTTGFLILVYAAYTLTMVAIDSTHRGPGPWASTRSPDTEPRVEGFNLTGAILVLVTSGLQVLPFARDERNPELES